MLSLSLNQMQMGKQGPRALGRQLSASLSGPSADEPSRSFVPSLPLFAERLPLTRRGPGAQGKVVGAVLLVPAAILSAWGWAIAACSCPELCLVPRTWFLVRGLPLFQNLVQRPRMSLRA